MCTTLANYNGNVGATTVVGSYPSCASKLGIQDLAGNVLECTSGENLGLLGGSYVYPSSFLRAAFRLNFVPLNRDSNYGFRCARTP